MKGKVVINKYIVSDPGVCHGKPVFAGTRIMVWQVLEMLEYGRSVNEILKAYPALTGEAVRAALAYATSKVKEVGYVPFAA